MRCRTCDYSLWNLKARQCPECGNEFRPSQYEFVINSVRFCCPHCEQAYYGTSIKGHLIPEEFICVSCGQQVHMDEMLLRPAEGVREEQTRVEPMPWLEREQRGWVKAWLATVGRALVLPARLMHAVPDRSRLKDAMWFAFITGVVVAAMTLVPRVLFVGVMFGAFAGPGMGMPGMTRIMMLFFAIPAFLMTVMPLAVVAICGLLVHGMLRVTGRLEHGLPRTYQALYYSTGACVVSAVPCFGLWFGWIWWAVSACIMVRKAHGVDSFRAIFSVAVGAVAGLALWIGTYFAVMTLIMAAAGPGRGFGTPARSETTQVTSALLVYANANNGAGPDHALRLVDQGFLASSFAASTTFTDPSKIFIGNVSLDQFDVLPAGRRQAAVQAAADLLPPNVIAHRCGDFVFTYHGLDLASCGPNLWIVIFSPDPDQNISRQTPMLFAGLADGSITPIFINPNSSILLDEQNKLRATYALPPLPDPATVTHAQPATAEFPQAP